MLERKIRKSHVVPRSIQTNAAVGPDEIKKGVIVASYELHMVKNGDFENLLKLSVETHKAFIEKTERIKVQSIALGPVLKEHVEPAPKAPFLVALLTPAGQNADFIANMEELFPDWVEKHGYKRAVWIWRSQNWQFLARVWLGYGFTLLDRIKGIVFS